MKLPSPVLLAMEIGFNRALRLDPESEEQFTALSGKVIAIELQGMDLTFYLMPSIDGVQLANDYDGEANTTIRGGVFSLLHTAMTEDRSRVLEGAVRIEGDVALGQKVQKILRNLDLDWEEPLSNVVGDVAAHEIGRVASQTFGFFSQVAQNFLRDTGEYLVEEHRDLPSKFEVEEFFSGVDEARSDVDRIEARINKIKGDAV